MLETTFDKISQDLCLFIENGIALNRAFDLIEATMQSPQELIAVNTLREAYIETEHR